MRHVIKMARRPEGGWRAECRCGWTHDHPNYGAAKSAGNQHKTEIHVARVEQRIAQEAVEAMTGEQLDRVARVEQLAEAMQ